MRGTTPSALGFLGHDGSPYRINAIKARIARDGDKGKMYATTLRREELQMTFLIKIRPECNRPMRVRYTGIPNSARMSCLIHHLTVYGERPIKWANSRTVNQWARHGQGGTERAEEERSGAGIDRFTGLFSVSNKISQPSSFGYFLPERIFASAANAWLVSCSLATPSGSG